MRMFSGVPMNGMERNFSRECTVETAGMAVKGFVLIFTRFVSMTLPPCQLRRQPAGLPLLSRTCSCSEILLVSKGSR